jgi:hypothetical protein
LTIVAYRTEVNIPEQGSAPLAGSGHRVVYEFDRFAVDAGQRLLLCVGQTGPIDLPPRAFEAQRTSSSGPANCSPNGSC